MDWKVIKTEISYKKAIKRTMEIFQALPGTAEADELDLLLVLVKDYEDKHLVMPGIFYPIRSSRTDPKDGTKISGRFSFLQ